MHSHAFQYKAISIHSLRVEGDERTGILTQLRRKFQSTPSVWRETPTARPPSYNDAISIHSLRVEGDRRSVEFED